MVEGLGHRRQRSLAGASRADMPRGLRLPPASTCDMNDDRVR